MIATIKISPFYGLHCSSKRCRVQSLLSADGSSKVYVGPSTIEHYGVHHKW